MYIHWLCDDVFSTCLPRLHHCWLQNVEFVQVLDTLFFCILLQAVCCSTQYQSWHGHKEAKNLWCFRSLKFRRYPRKEISSSNHWVSGRFCTLLLFVYVCLFMFVSGMIYSVSALEKPEVSKCLVICFIEVPKFVTLKLHVDESHRSYKGFWKWCRG